MDKIVPCIWFDQDALEAVELYVSLFEDSRINTVNHYFDGFFPEDFEGEAMPDGTVLDVEFELCGQKFAAVNGGPIFKPNPSISFYVVCKTAEQLDGLREKLLPGGFELMGLDEYPFAKRYCWLQDHYGVNWQLFLGTGEEDLDAISPCLLFVGKAYGRAQEAMEAYTAIFEDPAIMSVTSYGEMGDAGIEDPNAVAHAEFRLAGQSFVATDSNYDHQFFFSEGISFMVQCADQDEIDFFWGKLTEGGQEQPCGWLKDKFGVSWQIVPEELPTLSDQSDLERATRVNRALLQMTKIDIEMLKDAYSGK